MGTTQTQTKSCQSQGIKEACCSRHYSLDALPVHPANVWMVDETYIRYEGKWEYLFAVLDGGHGSILAQVFSPTRSVAPAFAVLEKAARRFNLAACGPIDVITDRLGSYPPAIQLPASQTKGQFRHRKVIGLKNGKVKNQYRRYKNLIENYYSEKRLSKHNSATLQYSLPLFCHAVKAKGY